MIAAIWTHPIKISLFSSCLWIDRTTRLDAWRGNAGPRTALAIRFQMTVTGTAFIVASLNDRDFSLASITAATGREHSLDSVAVQPCSDSRRLWRGRSPSNRAYRYLVTGAPEADRTDFDKVLPAHRWLPSPSAAASSRSPVRHAGRAGRASAATWSVRHHQSLVGSDTERHPRQSRGRGAGFS